MIYTPEQLATRCLKDLGLVAVDEVPTADEMADAIEILSSEIPQMQIRGMPIWNGSEVEIPQEYLTALSRRLGLAVGPSYGAFSVVDATAAIIPSESVLRQLSAKPVTGSVADAQYF